MCWDIEQYDTVVLTFLHRRRRRPQGVGGGCPARLHHLITENTGNKKLHQLFFCSSSFYSSRKHKHTDKYGDGTREQLQVCLKIIVIKIQITDYGGHSGDYSVTAEF